MRPEILAPAGDWDCAKAAVENGADAIYFGLERFNARMRAKNFTQADLPALMAFLHRRGVRGYVTFNTLVFADEIESAEDYLRTIIAAGVDAAIVPDIGICRLIRKISPDFPIHTSTQMTISSPAGVEFARELGAQLVVLARENSIKEIVAIQDAQQDAPVSLPLEVFVHGALCVAYSGQCLTSESLGGRSANRGECAQACRLPYDLISDGEQVDLGDRRYLLSPQDLSGLEVLPDLVKVGVSSLKIEGRLKAPEYVASITRTYRSALDKVMAELTGEPVPEFKPEEARYELEMSFSRGLYTGWFNGIDNQKLAHGRFGTKRGVYLGRITRVQGEAVHARLLAPAKPGDGIVFDDGKPASGEEGGRIYEIENKRGEAVLRFGRGHLNFDRIRAGQRIWKTNDPALDRDVRATFTGDKIRFQRSLTIEIHGRIGIPLTLMANDGEGHVVRLDSNMPLSAAENRPLTTERLRDQLGRLGNTPFKLARLDNQLEGEAIIPISELNRLRREIVARLDTLRAAPKRWALHNHEGTTIPDLSSPKAPEIVPEIIAVIRDLNQLAPAWHAGARTLYCEFENPKHYREAVATFRELQSEISQDLSLPNGQASEAASPKIQKPEGPELVERPNPDLPSSIWVAPPRIFKPGEEWILKQVRSSKADGYLVRHHEHLRFFSEERQRGDFSLNVANALTADYFLNHYGLERVTASYDLNIDQLEALLHSAPGTWFDITIHQHMPMFHMEHCVFCAFLSEGKDYHDCGRPCEKHQVALQDRVGAKLPLRADAGCRNTVFNNRAQTGAEYVHRLLSLGARTFRVEFINESPDEVSRTLKSYRQLLTGAISGTDLWRELKLLNQLGVTRGQIDTTPQVIHRKS